MDQAVSALEADDIDKFFKLTLSVIESAAKLLGISIVVDIFAVGGLLDKLKAILNIEQADFSVTDELLFSIEVSMQRMLTSALLVEAQVGTLTGRFKNQDTPRADMIATWKEPIVARIRTERLEFKNAGIKSWLLKSPEDGYWQPGLSEA